MGSQAERSSTVGAFIKGLCGDCVMIWMLSSSQVKWVIYSYSRLPAKLWIPVSDTAVCLDLFSWSWLLSSDESGQVNAEALQWSSLILLQKNNVSGLTRSRQALALSWRHDDTFFDFAVRFGGLLWTSIEVYAGFPGAPLVSVFTHQRRQRKWTESS